MTTTFNTGNPIGSTAAKDLSDNASNFDDASLLQSDTWQDRLGVTRDTVNGRIKKMGYTVPVAYASGIVFSASDNVKTVEEAGVVYAPLPSSLPFATTNFGVDAAKFFVVQGFTVNDTSVVYAFENVDVMTNSTVIFPLGKVLAVGDAFFVVQSAVTTIQLADGKYVKTAGDTVLMSWLDTTGATNENAKIQQLLNAGFVVKMPKGLLSIGSGGSVNLPTAGSLIGSGAPLYDNDNVGAWDNTGTLVGFTVNVDNKQSWSVANFSIENATDGITGGGIKTGNGYIRNVKTKTANHSQLFNLLCTDNAGALDPANGVVGGIVAEDCEHYGGVNGFVSKHHRVSFIRCKSRDTTSQGFTAISDNINAATTYNRATYTKFIDCESLRDNNGFRVYTRDTFSADPTNDVNTNDVLSAYGTEIIREKAIDSVQFPILIGDFTTASFASFNCENTIINGAYYSMTGSGFIRIQQADTVKISNCEFGAGNNVVVDRSQCTNVIIDDTNTMITTSTGVEVSPLSISDNATSFDMGAWTHGQRVQFTNTVATNVTGIVSPVTGKEINFEIDDNFTTLNIFTTGSYVGKGTIVRAIYALGVWRVISVNTRRQLTEKTVTFNTNMSGQWKASNANNVYFAATSSLNSLSSGDTTDIPNGTKLSFTMDAVGADVTINNPSSSFIWIGGTKPIPTANGDTLYCEFVNRDGKQIEVARRIYTTP